MNVPAGTFCWNELVTTDVARCRAFYAELFGWKPVETELGTGTYTSFHKGDQPVGGMMAMDGLPPHWTSYVAVEDVDEMTRRAASLGGRVCVPPTDVPTVGRFSVVQDPSGAAISIIRLGGV